MKMKIKKIFGTVLLLALSVLLCFAAAACGASGLSVDSTGKYSFDSVDGARYYVVEFYKSEDIENNAVKADANAVLKQTLTSEQGTTGTFDKVTTLPFGTYIPTVYAIKADKSRTDKVIGGEFIKGGELTTPEFVVQRDYKEIKISITDKILDDVYFVKEATYGYTAQIYDNEACTGTPVKEEVFGADVAYIPPTNSSKAIWFRNRSLSLELPNGTYYVKCKANGNSAALVTDSVYSDAVKVVLDGTSTDVKYVTYKFDKSAGSLARTSETALEFGNGKRQTFSNMQLVTSDWAGADGYKTADIVIDGDLYSFYGDASCDMHLKGKAGDTEGEAFTTGPRKMPIDKPDIRGVWKDNGDGTITVTMMNDFQYFVKPEDEKTT
ncbi:MAG: hypothetical protein HFK09_07815 [Clostridia bacterium]|nr:hypothetical protein [Clostridia bacterium]